MKFNSLAVTKQLVAEPNTWICFYTQEEGTENTPSGDRYARNRANIYRIYIKRKGYPVDVVAQRHKDGLIHCWGRWNEGEELSKPPQESTGPKASSNSPE